MIYRLLFQATWETLKAFAADPKRLGGELGMTAMLHTWGQNLSQHVHLHCLVPGGVPKAITFSRYALCRDTFAGVWSAYSGKAPKWVSSTV